MNAFEIATAVAERLPIRVFVFNDRRLGMVEHGHQTVYGRHPDYSTGQLDICSVARGLGAATFRVDHVDQLGYAYAQFASVAGPVVIEVAIDHEIVVPKQDRIATLVRTAPVAPPPPPKPQHPQLRLVN